MHCKYFARKCYFSLGLFLESDSRSLIGESRAGFVVWGSRGVLECDGKGDGVGCDWGKKCNMYADRRADWAAAALVRDGDHTVGLESRGRWFVSEGDTIPGYRLFWGKKLSDLCKWLNQTRSGSIDWLGRPNRGMKYRESRHVTCPSGLVWWGSWRWLELGEGEQFLVPLFAVKSDQWRGGLSLHEAFSCRRHFARRFWNHTWGIMTDYY